MNDHRQLKIASAENRRDEKPPNVSIIIVNWNRREDVIECLESVRRLDYPNCRIVVVDNASTDGSQQIIKEAFPEIVLIYNETNLGFTGGNNVGIRYALQHNAEYVWLLNYLFTTVLDGRNSHLSDGVQRALGRAPRDFSAYAKETAASGICATLERRYWRDHRSVPAARVNDRRRGPQIDWCDRQCAQH